MLVQGKRIVIRSPAEECEHLAKQFKLERQILLEAMPVVVDATNKVGFSRHALDLDWRLTQLALAATDTLPKRIQIKPVPSQGPTPRCVIHSLIEGLRFLGEPQVKDGLQAQRLMAFYSERYRSSPGSSSEASNVSLAKRFLESEDASRWLSRRYRLQGVNTLLETVYPLRSGKGVCLIAEAGHERCFTQIMKNRSTGQYAFEVLDSLNVGGNPLAGRSELALTPELHARVLNRAGSEAFRGFGLESRTDFESRINRYEQLTQNEPAASAFGSLPGLALLTPAS